MQRSKQHIFRSARSASIAALAASLDARMEGEPEPTPPAAPTPPSDPAPTPAPTPEPAPPKGNDTPPHGDPPPKDQQDTTDWKAEARKHEDRSKANRAAAEKAEADKAAAEAARLDAEAKQQEFQDGLAKLLGYKQDDAPPDPSELQQTIASRDAELTNLKVEHERVVQDRDTKLREMTVELAAWRAASAQGVNAAKLLNLRSFHDTIVALDPAEDAFAANLDAAVKQALAEDDALRLVAVPGAGAAGIGTRGGSDFASVAPGNARISAAYSSS